LPRQAVSPLLSSSANAPANRTSSRTQPRSFRMPLIYPRWRVCRFPVMVEESPFTSGYPNLLSMSETHPSILYLRASVRLPTFFICLLIR